LGTFITDLAAIIQAAWHRRRGNINPEGVSMFEPMGRSAPKIHRQERHQTLWPPFAPAA